jgi:signal transduction histidine kinase
VQIKRDLQGGLGLVQLVPQEIGRVMLNLLGNAFDAVHEHAAKVNGVYNPIVTVTTRQVEGHVEVRVSDNGPGIPADIKEKVFLPFFTTKPAGSGTGLGLSLSHDIVANGHGGTLAVESEEGHGATFIVALPS